MTPEQRRYLSGILLLLGATTIWSTVPIGTRLLMREGAVFSPAFISVVRLWIAALVLLAGHACYVRATGRPFLQPIKRKGWLLAASAAIGLNYLLYATGMRYANAGATAIISQVSVVGTVLLAAALLGERLTRQKVAGMVLALAGVLLVMMQGAKVDELVSSKYLWGNLVQFTAALLWPWYAISQTKLAQVNANNASLLPIFLLAALLSALMLPFTGPSFLHSPGWQHWFLLIFLGAISTAAAYWLFALGLQRVETSLGALINMLMPPMALFMAHFMLGEDIRATDALGLVLVIIGLAGIIWRRGHSPVARGFTLRRVV